MARILRPRPLLIGHDGAIQVCNWTTGKKVREIKPPWAPRPFKTVCAVDRPVAATTNGDRKILVWDLAAGKLLQTIELTDSKDQGFGNLALSADGKTLVATCFRALADDDVGTLLIYDLSATIPREGWDSVK